MDRTTGKKCQNRRDFSKKCGNQGEIFAQILKIEFDKPYVAQTCWIHIRYPNTLSASSIVFSRPVGLEVVWETGDREFQKKNTPMSYLYRHNNIMQRHNLKLFPHAVCVFKHHCVAVLPVMLMAHLALGQSLEMDYRSLEALYKATNGDSWTNNDNWDFTAVPGEDELGSWYGITQFSGRVTELILIENNLTGIIPAEIGDLQQLSYLDLDGNSLTGSIPVEIGSLQQLSTLILGGNSLIGSIPAEVGNLQQLHYLNLSNNSLIGPIPVEIGNIQQLQFLYLRQNSLTGAIPAEIGDLQQLEELVLSDNSLIGSIPSEIGKLRRLERLTMEGNMLTGLIPPEIGNLQHMEIIELDGNMLTGPIPPEIGNLIQLRSISLRENSLTGPIPPEIGNTRQLQNLILARNSLTGVIPMEIGNLQQLRVLWLSENALTGSIPTEIGSLHQLQDLNLFQNALTGSIPAEIGSLHQLQHLNLFQNALTGSVPPEIGDLQQLQRLDLHNNAFTGELPPSLMQLDQLEMLAFHGSEQHLCAPEDATFQTWLDNIQEVIGPNCGELQFEDGPVTEGQGTAAYKVELPEVSGGMPPYTYTVASDLPEGLVFNASTRTVRGSPTSAVPPATYKYKAMDSDGTDSIMRFTMQFHAVVFQGMIDDQSLTLKQSVAPIMFPDASGGVPPYLYTLMPSLPGGLVFNASTRTISGTPTATMPTTTYTYEATDSTGSRSTLTFTMEVVQAVAFQGAINNQSLARGQSMMPVTFPEVSGGVAPIRYDVTPTLLEGLAFNASTRILSGTPTMITDQSQSYKYRATDVNGSSDSLLFTIDVFSPVANEQQVSLPESFMVHGNYPNPFQASTRLLIDLPQPAHVAIEVMDLTGRRILTMPAQILSAGWEHSLLLDGQGLPSGLYTYRIIAASAEEKFMHTGSFIRIR